ncbi:AI-2E family transporter [Lutimaribacter marinistellae]|uniref:AI-2E family transporter n=1 Tax=Lutimaribacter marinistellae TaxID=1820329 RepID=A0ABV7TLW9_9RHOB
MTTRTPIEATSRNILSLLAIIVVFAVLEAGQVVFAPILCGIVFGVVCGPLVDLAERFKLPQAVAALAALFLFLAIVLLLYLFLEPTVREAIRNAPLIWRELTAILETVRDTLRGVEEIQKSVNDALNEDAGGAGTVKVTDEKEGLNMPGLKEALAYGPSLVGGILIFVGTLYFFMATRREVYGYIANYFPRMSFECLHDAEKRVSRYFLTISMVNAGFGLVVMLAMTAYGVPQPALWGLATFLLNFILYLGPILVATALLVTGVVVFDGFFSFVPALTFLFFNMIEAQFVTPSTVGRVMALNPLFVFLSLVLWMWLWGPIGGLVAIPLLVWLIFVTTECNLSTTQQIGDLEEQEEEPLAAE